MKFIKDHLLLHKARSCPHFFDLIRENGMTIQYGDTGPTGVIDTSGKSYSWRKLGITPSHFHMLDQRAHLQRIDERLKKLEHLRSVHQPERSIEP